MADLSKEVDEIEKKFSEGQNIFRRPSIETLLMAYRSLEMQVPNHSPADTMKAFIRELFDEYYPECGDIDGGSLQDMAEKHGILIPEIRHDPCGDFCTCAEMCGDDEWEDGVKCYRLAHWLLDQQSGESPK